MSKGKRPGITLYARPAVVDLLVFNLAMKYPDEIDPGIFGTLPVMRHDDERRTLPW